MKDIGLTLGKYAPLHKGHQLIIERALKERDEVWVVIYDVPETTSIPLETRTGWIRKIYPGVKVIEARNGPTEVGYTDEIKKIHEDYLINSLKIEGISAFYSSEFYGEHISRALGAKNIQVDPDRLEIPVSGTEIRKNPFKYRKYMDPIVYRDLITKVAFLGAPSTGKTTIAEKLAKEYKTTWVPEYGREYWEKNQVNRRLAPEQLTKIAEEQIRIEDKMALDSNKYLFIDTNAVTTYVFSLDYHGTASSRLRELAENAKNKYDFVFLCGTDIPYDDTWDRSGDVKRGLFQERTVDYLKSNKIKYQTLIGDLEERAVQVKEVLDKRGERI